MVEKWKKVHHINLKMLEKDIGTESPALRTGNGGFKIFFD